MSPGPQAYFKTPKYDREREGLKSSEKKRKEILKELDKKNYYKPMNKILF